jgi:septation ring formation regulator EzrA
MTIEQRRTAIDRLEARAAELDTEREEILSRANASRMAYAGSSGDAERMQAREDRLELETIDDALRLVSDDLERLRSELAQAEQDERNDAIAKRRAGTLRRASEAAREAMLEHDAALTDASRAVETALDKMAAACERWQEAARIAAEVARADVPAFRGGPPPQGETVDAWRQTLADYIDRLRDEGFDPDALFSTRLQSLGGPGIASEHIWKRLRGYHLPEGTHVAEIDRLFRDQVKVR